MNTMRRRWDECNRKWRISEKQRWVSAQSFLLRSKCCFFQVEHGKFDEKESIFVERMRLQLMKNLVLTVRRCSYQLRNGLRSEIRTRLLVWPDLALLGIDGRAVTYRWKKSMIKSLISSCFDKSLSFALSEQLFVRWISSRKCWSVRSRSNRCTSTSIPNKSLMCWISLNSNTTPLFTVGWRWSPLVIFPST